MEMIKKDANYNYALSHCSTAIVNFLRKIDTTVAYFNKEQLEKDGFFVNGSVFSVTSSYRTLDKQLELYCKGRKVFYTRETDKNKGYRFNITYSCVIDEGKIETNAKPGRSYHNWGLAVDVVLNKVGYGGVGVVTYKGKKYNTNLPKDIAQLYSDIGIVGFSESFGLSYGGKWIGFIDAFHFENNIVLPPSDYDWSNLCGFINAVNYSRGLSILTGNEASSSVCQVFEKKNLNVSVAVVVVLGLVLIFFNKKR